ncbi:MAG: hypothetical protein PHX61_14635 [Alphaproteobacteria bacterium]|nr:hypothetical protein [Alphaproteobacteria bacterium]
MDSDFLEEYENREIDALKRNIPISERIGKLKTPIFNLVEDSHSFWSQIAFSGTTIFPLHPIPSIQFEQAWNISTDEIPDLIKFVRDTGKIQFVLTEHPNCYKEFDYLEPILRKFSPPIYSSNVNIFDEKLHELWLIHKKELEHLIHLSPEWQRQMETTSGRHVLGTHLKSYVLLRYYGFDKIADTFIENFVAYPNFAHTYIAIVEYMILYPIGDPLNANLSLSIDTIQKATDMGLSSTLETKKNNFPEVGSYLMKKCTQYPESLDACKNLMSLYEDNDLYKIHSALNDAIVGRDNSGIILKKSEMAEVLDNVWQDKRIKNRSTTCRLGIDATFGIIGYALGDVSGLLGSIIPEFVNSTESHYLDHYSDLIAKGTAKPYMATIYDFKKKYQIDH